MSESSNLFLILSLKIDREDKVHSSSTKCRIWTMAISINFTNLKNLETTPYCLSSIATTLLGGFLSTMATCHIQILYYGPWSLKIDFVPFQTSLDQVKQGCTIFLHSLYESTWAFHTILYDI